MNVSIGNISRLTPNERSNIIKAERNDTVTFKNKEYTLTSFNNNETRFVRTDDYKGCFYSIRLFFGDMMNAGGNTKLLNRIREENKPNIHKDIESWSEDQSAKINDVISLLTNEIPRLKFDLLSDKVKEHYSPDDDVEKKLKVKSLIDNVFSACNDYQTKIISLLFSQMSNGTLAVHYPAIFNPPKLEKNADGTHQHLEEKEKPIHKSVEVLNDGNIKFSSKYFSENGNIKYSVLVKKNSIDLLEIDVTKHSK
jgi:hypothetical protein